VSTFETGVSIERAIDDVFAYVSDPLNMSHWYSAVQTVRSLSGAQRQVGATYLMERRLPGGAAQNELEIVTSRPPTEFTIRTTSGPTPLIYRYVFTAEADRTLIQLHATFELDGVAALAGPFAVRGVKRGMDANLAALKTLLERSAPPGA
jgi:uncharacterized protein YndB with AHSA1/START domain